MITLRNISKNFDGKTVLKGASLTIQQDKFFALVGENGTGKSTLLKIAAGLLEPDEGKREVSHDLKFFYCPQELTLEQQEMTGEEYVKSQTESQTQCNRSDDNEFVEEFSLPEQKLKKPVKLLSGGEKSKLILYAAMRSQADVFLFDEPTNNLDLPSLILLERFLKSISAGGLIVSHDRKLLNNLASGIIEIDSNNRSLNFYPSCNYQRYLEEKNKNLTKQEKEYQDYSEEKRRLEKSVQLSQARAREMQKGPKVPRDHDKYVVGFKKDRSKKLAGHASALQKRIERAEDVQRPISRLPFNLTFEISRRSGDIVFRFRQFQTCNEVLKIGPIDFDVFYGDRIAILGTNGSGKTTFLKNSVGGGNYQGIFSIGSNVEIGYLPQEIIFSENQNVLTYFLEKSGLDETNGRRILFRFGFEEGEINKKLFYLSPGEKSRLILAGLMARKANCLILDEPTNHLDFEALDRLESALQNFSGTLIVISHDRYFLDRIQIARTYLMDNGLLKSMKDYHEYEDKIMSS